MAETQHPRRTPEQFHRLTAMEVPDAERRYELIIEVADTSLEHDHAIKLTLYARHLTPEYWIVYLRERVVEAYRESRDDEYRSLRRHTTDETITPLLDSEWQVLAGGLWS